MKRPAIMRLADRALNPLIGKSVVVYAAKPAAVVTGAGHVGPPGSIGRDGCTAGRAIGRPTVHSSRLGTRSERGGPPAARPPPGGAHSPPREHGPRPRQAAPSAQATCHPPTHGPSTPHPHTASDR